MFDLLQEGKRNASAKPLQQASAQTVESATAQHGVLTPFRCCVALAARPRSGERLGS